MRRSIIALTTLALMVTLSVAEPLEKGPSHSAVLAGADAFQAQTADLSVENGDQPVATEHDMDQVLAPQEYSEAGPTSASAVDQAQSEIVAVDGATANQSSDDSVGQSGGAVVPLQSGGAESAGVESGPSESIGKADSGMELLTLAQADINSDVAVAGVTFQGGMPAEQVDFLYRIRYGDEWTAWTDWEPLDPNEAREQGGVPGSEPITVTDAKQIEVAARSTGSAVLPSATLTVIDPSGTTSDDPDMNGVAMHSGEDKVSNQATLRNGLVPAGLSSDGRVFDTNFDGLKISTRAGWDADESLRYPEEDIIKVRGAVIHHTAGTNNYTRAQVPSLIRAIYYYHAVTLDWGDVGYNFLVDKFGGVWEGRKNSLTRSVKGAHAYGANSDTFGISVLGDYSTNAPSAAAEEAVAKTIAWKLGQVGVTSIEGTITTRQGIVIPIVSGHRDVGATACPGQAFYDRLPAVRTRIRTLMVQTPTPVPDTPSWEPRRQIGNGWSSGEMLAAGAFSGPGAADAALIDAVGDMWLYPGTDGAGFASRRRVGTEWKTVDQINMGSDFDGDNNPDVLARRKRDNALILYPGDGRGGFKPARQVGQGWGGFSRIVVLPDANQGRPVVLGVVTGTGRLSAYRTNGHGVFTDVLLMGYDWDTMTSLIPIADRTGDGLADVLATDAAGVMWLYSGDDAGRLTARRQVGQGWRGYHPIRAANTRTTGVLWTVDSLGFLWRYRLVN